MIDISIVSLAGRMMDIEELRYHIHFSQEERYAVSLFAFRSDSTDHTENMVKEMAAAYGNIQPVIDKYNAILDSSDACIGNIEELLVLLEMLRIQRARAVSELREKLRDYGYDIVPVDHEMSETYEHNGSVR